MFLMLKGLLLYSQHADDVVTWLEKYYPMLALWADEMIQTLPFPADQLSTDDFMGSFANNTNLAAKGIIALEAFADICEAVIGNDSCKVYSKKAGEFAVAWKENAISLEGDHYLMAFNGPDWSYSVKYNLVWQKLLKMDLPFLEWDEIAATEVAYYRKKSNRYGPPLESHIDGTRPIFMTMMKLDWLAWAATMANTQESWDGLFDFIYNYANESRTRVVLSDLYDTITGISFAGVGSAFVDRPVIGAVFAKMLIAGEN